jgi:hypothetical protein
VNCLEFRREILADPYDLSAEARAHRDRCSTCERFYTETRDTDRNIHQAMKIDLPEGLTARILLKQSLKKNRVSRARWSWLAAPASNVAAAIFGDYFSTRPPPLDKLLVSHIEGELGMVQRMSGPVRQPTIHEVLNQIHLGARQPLRHVVFAANCVIEGELVAHLVVQDGTGRYTVILIPHRALDKTEQVEQRQWHGVIKPDPAGTLAVISNADDPGDRIANRIASEFGASLVRLGV